MADLMYKLYLVRTRIAGRITRLFSRVLANLMGKNTLVDAPPGITRFEICSPGLKIRVQHDIVGDAHYIWVFRAGKLVPVYWDFWFSN